VVGFSVGDDDDDDDDGSCNIDAGTDFDTTFIRKCAVRFARAGIAVAASESGSLAECFAS